MKKWFGLIAAVVMLFAMTMGASAEAVTAKGIYTFDALDAGLVLFSDADETGTVEDYSDKDVGQWSATVVAEGGQSGNALKLTNMKFTHEHFVYLPMGADNASADLSGTKALYVYVDATGNDGVQIGLRLRAVTGENEITAFVPKSNRGSDNDLSFGAYYIQDSKGEWVKPSNAIWHRATLPKDYKGWVKWVISDTTVMPQWWGTDAQKAAKISDNLDAIHSVGFHLQGVTSTVILDTFAAEGVAGADVTIIEDKKDDTTTTTAKKDDTTTAAGATTGEAAPVAAAVTLVVAGGAVVALRKRSK